MAAKKRPHKKRIPKRDILLQKINICQEAAVLDESVSMAVFFFLLLRILRAKPDFFRFYKFYKRDYFFSYCDSSSFVSWSSFKINEYKADQAERHSDQFIPCNCFMV